MNGKFEYRCTRAEAYTADCPGRTSVSSRQGHYIKADSQLHAALEMKKSFPTEVIFDVETVKDPDGNELPKAQRSLTRYRIKATEHEFVALPVEKLLKARACMGSGYCCVKSQCIFSVEAHGRLQPGKVCPSLLWNGERHLCELMQEGLGKFTDEYVKRTLAEGEGCCSPLNSWRREPLKDRRRLHVL